MLECLLFTLLWFGGLEAHQRRMVAMCVEIVAEDVEAALSGWRS